MLRILVAALLLANLAFYTWSQGWLDGVVGARSIGDREPERMSRQLRPELVRVLPAAPASAAPGATAASDAASASTAGAPPASAPGFVSTAASLAPACLEAGPFSDAALAAAQAAARTALPDANLTVATTTTPAIWMVYMGRYADHEALKRKEAELGRRQLSFEEVRGNLAPGLSLGRFDDRNDAVRAMEQFAQRGLHTARIVAFAPAATLQTLRIEQAGAALVSLATSLKLPALGKGFAPCARTS